MTNAERFPALYYDGRSARAQDVSVAIDGAGVSIYRNPGVFLASWQAQNVVLADRPEDGEPLRIGLEGATARLVVADPAALAVLLDAIPQAQRRLRTSRRSVIRAAGWTGGAIAAVAFILLVLIPVLSEQLARQTPMALKQRIGAATLEQVVELISYLPGERKQVSYCVDRQGLIALRDLAWQMVRTVENRPNVRLKVIDARLVNAFALPGAHLVLTEGLLLAADSPAEVAGVIAHEMGHVMHEHPTQAIFRTTAVSLLVSAMIGDFTGGVLVGALAEWAVNSSYSRSAERQADEFAIALLNAAGIDGGGLVRFFERLENSGNENGEADGVMDFLSTHPPSRERIDRIRAGARADGPALDAADWVRLRGICNSLISAGPASRNAAAR